MLILPPETVAAVSVSFDVCFMLLMLAASAMPLPVICP